jgi:hypothetical protein
MRSLLPALIAALLALILVSPTASAQSSPRSVEWQNYNVDLALQNDGSVAVTESQTIDFHGTYQQGYRVIPLDRTTGVTNVSVAEVVNGQSHPYSPAAGPGQPGTFTTSTDANGLTVDWWFPSTTDASRAFVLTYTAHGATRLYQDSAQLDWNAIYSDRPGPIDASTVTMHLPADVSSSQVMSALYTVPLGRLPQQVGTATLVDPRTLRFDVGPLPTATGAETRAQFPASIVPNATEPPWQAAADRADWLQQTVAPIGNFLVLLLTLAVVAGGGAGLFVLWYTRGRQPTIPGTPPTSVEEPPSDLPAPLAGTLVDGVADLQDAVATLVDLGQRGVLSLEQRDGDVSVSLHRRTMDPALRSYERVLLVALFGETASEGEIMLSAARPRFASAVPFLERRLYQAVADARLFTANPMTTRAHYQRLGLTVAAVGALLAVVTTVLFGWVISLVWAPGVALILLGAGLMWLSRSVATQRTPLGALEAQRWRAFRAHLLEHPDGNSLNDGYLPYAVAFGIDRDFLRRLEWHGAASPPMVSAPRGAGPIIFFPGPWMGGGYGGDRGSGGRSSPLPTGPVGSGSAGGPQSWSDALADLLNAASGALSHGGGSGPWGGGGWGGGGGGGGGSGGFG